jgi:predicted outer membrane protein
MMSRMPTTMRALLALAALVLTACGSSGDDTTAARKRFIARTDVLCKASNARTRALNLRLLQRAADARDDRQLLRRLAPILHQGNGPVHDTAAALRANDPPAADAARVEGIRRVYDEQAQLVRQLASAAARVEVSRFKSLSEHQKEVVLRARRLAHDYGFKECGSQKSDVSAQRR